MEVSQFDDELKNLIEKAEAQPDDVALTARLCYELNIRSFHQTCCEYARHGLKKDPNHAGLYYELIIASSLDTAHCLLTILGEIEAILLRRPKDLGARRNLALVHFIMESDDQAEAILGNIIEETSELAVDKETYEILAQLAYSRQDLDECLAYCEKAIGKPGFSARTIRLKGMCYLDLGDSESAMKCFQYALELEPFFVWACHSLAGLCMEEKDFVRAFRFFGKALYINPNDAGNLFLLAEAFMDMEAFDLAAAEMHKLLLLGPEKRIEAEAHNALGYLHIRQGQGEKARAHLDQALELEPELALAHFNIGQLYQQKKDPANARKAYQKAIDTDAQLAEAWVELGFLNFSQKKQAAAKKCFRKGIEIDGFDAQAHLGLSKLYQKEKDHENQLNSALEAYQLDPDQSEICNNLAIAFECNGRFEEAEEAYLRALELNPMQAAAANNLGHLYERLMKLEPDQAEENKRNAIDAWKQRLTICVIQKRSLKAATTHLLKLGLRQKEIDSIARNAKKSDLRT